VSCLLLRLGSYLEASSEAIAETEVRHVNRDEERVYLPDISVTLNERASRQVRGAVPEMPDFAIEVLSPDARTVRVLDKVDFYLRNGVRLVWLVDPLERSVGAYRPGERAAIAEAGDTIDARPVLKNFSLALDDLFSVMPEQEETPGSS
jgi:Uma2 family endonuclease